MNLTGLKNKRKDITLLIKKEEAKPLEEIKPARLKKLYASRQHLSILIKKEMEKQQKNKRKIRGFN